MEATVYALAPEGSLDDHEVIARETNLFDAVATALNAETAYGVQTFIQYQQTDRSFWRGLPRSEWREWL